MTRADFYVKEEDKYTLIGCTSNNYNGDFEEAKTAKQFIESVRKMLIEENDKRNYISDQKLAWPWTCSTTTDEVFIFEIVKPKFWQFFKPKESGVVYQIRDCIGTTEFPNRVIGLPIDFEWEDIDEDGVYTGKLKQREFDLPELKK